MVSACEEWFLYSHAYLACSHTLCVPLNAVSALRRQFFVGYGEGPQGILKQLLIQLRAHLVPILGQVIQQDTEEIKRESHQHNTHVLYMNSQKPVTLSWESDTNFWLKCQMQPTVWSSIWLDMLVVCKWKDYVYLNLCSLGLRKSVFSLNDTENCNMNFFKYWQVLFLLPTLTGIDALCTFDTMQQSTVCLK